MARPMARSVARLAALLAGLGLLVFAHGVYRDLPSEKRRETAIRASMIELALRDYRADHGGYPPPDVGLSALLSERPPNRGEGLIASEAIYLAKEEWLEDGWGRPFRYSVSDGGCAVASLGRDGRREGSGEDADIVWPCPD